MECSIYIDPVLNTSFRFMVLMLTEKFEIDKLLIEKSMRKTNSCYERHKFCTLLDIYFDLKCNKAWVKEEAGFGYIHIHHNKTGVKSFSSFSSTRYFDFQKYLNEPHMHLLLAWDWFSLGTISHQCIVISFFVCDLMCW